MFYRITAKGITGRGALAFAVAFWPGDNPVGKPTHVNDFEMGTVPWGALEKPGPDLDAEGSPVPVPMSDAEYIDETIRNYWTRHTARPAGKRPADSRTLAILPDQTGITDALAEVAERSIPTGVRP